MSGTSFRSVRFSMAHLLTEKLPARRMARSSSRSTRRRKGKSARPVQRKMVLQKRNYQLIALGVAALAIGYGLMAFENDVDGVLSLYVAPVVLIAGYLEIFYALLWRPASDDVTEESSASS